MSYSREKTLSTLIKKKPRQAIGYGLYLVYSEFKQFNKNLKYLTNALERDLEQIHYHISLLDSKSTGSYNSHKLRDALIDIIFILFGIIIGYFIMTVVSG